MSVISVGPKGKKGGRLPVAYLVHSGMPDCINMRPGQYLQTQFDCEGKMISICKVRKCLVETEDGQEVLELHCCGGLTAEGFKGDGIIIDLRSLEATAAGCCPPALTVGMLGEDVDVVAEAIKLHKRGYFGGGG